MVIGGISLSGGVGRVTGTLIGALIIGVMNNGLDLMGIESYYQQVLKGILIVGAVMLDQRGNSGRVTLTGERTSQSGGVRIGENSCRSKRRRRRV